MKILVITYYKDLNPGTVLQALGVKTGLLSIFPDANIEFLRTTYRKKESNSEKLSINSFQLILNKYYNYIRKKKFEKITKKLFIESDFCFDYFEYDEGKFLSYADTFDIISTGSDTILEKIATKNQIGLMWGDSKRKSAQITFSASGDSSEENKLKKEFHEELAKKVRSLSFIGIRDDITKAFLINYLKVPAELITKQPDPTYLLSLEQFKLKPKNISKLAGQEKLAIFHFDRRFIYRKELATILKKMGYKLITPEYDPSCDISFKHMDIYEWGGLFKYCEIVFTERFHDTVFALRFNKPVFTFDWNKDKYNDEGLSKRSEILKDFDLLSHHFKIIDQSDIECVPEKVKTALAKFSPNKINVRNEQLISLSHALLETIKNSVEHNNILK